MSLLFLPCHPVPCSYSLFNSDTSVSKNQIARQSCRPTRQFPCNPFCYVACFTDDVTKLRVWQKALLLKYFMWKEEKRRRKTYPRSFWKLLLISWKVFSELCLQRFVASYKFGSRPAINLCLELSFRVSRGIRNKTLEARLKNAQMSQTCNWLSEYVMKGQLDTSAPNPGPVLIQCPLQNETWVCFLHCLWHKVFTDLTETESSLWLFYWL